MPARIRIYGHEALFQGGHWTCPEDDSLQAMLEGLADPRALSHEEEQAHATYCAGKFGGLIHTPFGWETAAHPEPEIRLEDFAPQHKPERAGWLSFMRKRAR